MRVASSSNPGSIAGAITGRARNGEDSSLEAIGAGAVSQAVKAILIANNFLRNDGIELSAVPSYVDCDINGETRTSTVLKIRRSKKE